MASGGSDQETGLVFTIGHSNRSFADFLALLREFGIEQLVDVRRFPTSRKFPHFSRDALAAALAEHGIRYAHMGDLGGRRSRLMETSPNKGWRVEGFNAYADHLMSPEGRRSLDELERLATQGRTAIMCAESVPWRCHRQLIADHFLARGWRVFHILGPGQLREHKLPPFAVITPDSLVIYPESDREQLPFPNQTEEERSP